MEVSREKMLHHLRRAAEVPVRRIFTAELRPISAPAEIFVNIQKFPRLIIPLERDKRILFARDGIVEDRVFTPGEVLLCPENCWSAEAWDREHAMVSVVFREHCVRVLFIHHRGDSTEQNGPDIFYHTLAPLSTPGTHLLQALLTSERGAEAQLFTLRALLHAVLETVENDSAAVSGKESFTWDCVREYLEMNFPQNLSRESIAGKLHLHPASLSRLVRKMTGTGVIGCLTRLRMEHARKLLESNDLTIDEIAGQCGYSYTSYFIRRFREYYSESPFRYREKLRRENRKRCRAEAEKE